MPTPALVGVVGCADVVDVLVPASVWDLVFTAVEEVVVWTVCPLELAELLLVADVLRWCDEAFDPMFG